MEKKQKLTSELISHMIYRHSLNIGLLVVMLTGFVAGCDNDSNSTTNTYCVNPSPLTGQLDPDAPGYIVVFNENIDSITEVNRLINIYAIQVGFIFNNALKGFYGEMSNAEFVS